METAPTNGREQPGAPKASTEETQIKQQTENAGPAPASQARRLQPRVPDRRDFWADRLADLYFRNGADEWWTAADRSEAAG